MEAQTEQDRWYCELGSGERLGPLSRAGLAALVASGSLQAGHQVWHTSWPEWVAAETVPGLLAVKGKGLKGWPSDALPLWLVAGIVACFVLHFSQRRFLAAAPVAKMAAAAGASSDDDAPEGDPSAIEAAGAAAAAEHAGETYDLEICNHTSVGRLYVAVAYYDALRVDWVARGWYPQNRGECRTALKGLTPPIYVYAETRDGAARWGDGEGVPFCLDGKGAFVMPQARCEHRDPRGHVRFEHFKELQLSGEGGVHTWELTE